jgi:hypothetical protein
MRREATASSGTLDPDGVVAAAPLEILEGAVNEPQIY